jgi:hypothetical protein
LTFCGSFLEPSFIVRFGKIELQNELSFVTVVWTIDRGVPEVGHF